MLRFLAAVLVTGLILNLTGWAGKVFLLGPMWESAVALAPPPMHSPFPPLVHAILQFLSDFVFGFIVCLVSRLGSVGWGGSRMQLALLSATMVWLGGVPMTYLGLVNGGYWPAGVSVATTILALLTFIMVAPLLPWLLSARQGSA